MVKWGRQLCRQQVTIDPEEGMTEQTDWLLISRVHVLHYLLTFSEQLS